MRKTNWPKHYLTSTFMPVKSEIAALHSTYHDSDYTTLRVKQRAVYVLQSFKAFRKEAKAPIDREIAATKAIVKYEPMHNPQS